MRPLRFMYRKLERIEVANLDFIRCFSSCHQRHQATSDREPCDRRCANPNSAHKDPILFSRLAVLPACYQVALDAKGRYRIGGGQVTPRGAPT